MIDECGVGRNDVGNLVGDVGVCMKDGPDEGVDHRGEQVFESWDAAVSIHPVNNKETRSMCTMVGVAGVVVVGGEGRAEVPITGGDNCGSSRSAGSDGFS